MTQIKDYLQLYLGSTVCHPNGQTGELIGVCGDDAHFIHDETGSYGFCGIDSPLFGKISLRPLTNITDLEFLSIFKMAIGCYEDMNVSEFKRWSSTDLFVRLGHGQFIFGFVKHPKPDVRVQEGYSLFIKQYQIETRLELSEKGLAEFKSEFNYESLQIAFNQSTIFNKLRKDGFDCDGLINAGLAIDKTKIK